MKLKKPNPSTFCGCSGLKSNNSSNLIIYFLNMLTNKYNFPISNITSDFGIPKLRYSICNYGNVHLNYIFYQVK